MTALLCTGCDAHRDQESAFCECCGEATDSYRADPDDGQVWLTNGSGSYLGVMRTYSDAGMAIAAEASCREPVSSFDTQTVSPAVADEIRGLGHRWAA